MPLTPAIIRQIVRDAANLHKCGTFELRPLEALAAHLGNRRIYCSAETGSGASTLLFSHCSDLHLAFTIDSGGGSVVNVKASPLLIPDRVSWIEGPTQLTLPAYRFRQPLQAALIDGPHAYPFPDLEYYYLHQSLDVGALLVLDDIHIKTIHNLFNFLKEEDMFVLDEVVQTTAFFTRTDAPLFSPIGDGWWNQKYNRILLSEQVSHAEPSVRLKSYQQTITSSVKNLTLKPGQRASIPVVVTNPGPDPWTTEGENPVDLSYHWIHNDEVIPIEGERASLPQNLAPAQSATLNLTVVAPDVKGQLTLGISMVQEGVTWFATAPSGSWYRIAARVE